ncbi:MAG: hypothetical protein WC717_00025 [Candidatus Micrarchaeia archaeon]|jgi:hypothetical protein
MRHIIPIFPLLLAVALSGCTQGGIPQSCAGTPPGELSNCIYVSAVLGQNPYQCYSLSDLPQREKCLRDSSDPAAVKQLERMSMAERAEIFASGPTVPPGSVPPSEAPASGTVPAPEPGQPSAPEQADALLYEQATAENDMAACTAIASQPTRESCITQIALQVKNPEICATLSQADDIDLCNLYAKGGEQAK